ncbi:MAG: protein kinase [Gemmataceae bacterium]
MDREEQIDHLLDRWQQLREEGRPITPEELCREAPDLLPSLRLRIEAVSRIEGLLGDPAPNATPPFRGRSSRETVIVGVAGPPQAPPGYELHSELGRGGVGVVYKAKQLGLKRLVALKMLLTGAHASAEDRRRFRREAETIARLAHPNIVQVYEIGEHEGRAFLALEFLDGGTLADRLREQPMPTPRAAELARTLAVAVEAAHRASVVHRDLKPANVLMTAAGVPKISDFGLAKRLDDDRGRTGTGAILGTPAYMAPEQAEGRGATGPGVDVYALGAILYECLTGQVPFRAATMFELLDLVRHADPVPPTRLNDKIPRDLETVCLKCLEKDPARRYATAAALADDLRRYLAGEAILARPVGLVERGWRWSRRGSGSAAGWGPPGRSARPATPVPSLPRRKPWPTGSAPPPPSACARPSGSSTSSPRPGSRPPAPSRAGGGAPSTAWPGPPACRGPPRRAAGRGRRRPRRAGPAPGPNRPRPAPRLQRRLATRRPAAGGRRARPWVLAQLQYPPGRSRPAREAVPAVLPPEVGLHPREKARARNRPLAGLPARRPAPRRRHARRATPRLGPDRVAAGPHDAAGPPRSGRTGAFLRRRPGDLYA